MNFFSNVKKTRETLKEIRERLEDGEKLSVQSIVSKYFIPKSGLAIKLSTQKATTWLCNLTKKYNFEGRMFGRLNEAGEYGFPDGPEEALCIGNRAYKDSKGHYLAATRKVRNGVKQGLIKSKGERVELLSPIKLEFLKKGE